MSETENYGDYEPAQQTGRRGLRPKTIYLRFGTRVLVGTGMQSDWYHPNVLHLRIHATLAGRLARALLCCLPSRLSSWLASRFPEWALPADVVLKRAKDNWEWEFSTEVAAYKKLESVQGRVIPICYGETEYDGARALILSDIGGGCLSDPEGAVLTEPTLEPLLGAPLRALTDRGIIYDDLKLDNFRLVERADTLDWRWVEWIVLILSAALLVHVLLFMPETYGPLLLRWKALYYRQITGDPRFVAEDDLAGSSFLGRLRISMTRPFLMLTEPIIIAMTLYITVLYIILFTFLIGWTYIFEETYGISQGLTHVIFIAMFIGMQLVVILAPFIYRKTAQAIHCQSGESTKKCVGFNPELRLWFAMLGPAFAIPISLFWMGWTARPDISIWSPILAAVLFGFGMSGMFICVYLYVIDSYEVYSASALTFASLVRYFAAGGMTVAGIPFYENMGTAYTLTILACISLVLVPVSYLLYFYGHKLRARSKYAVSWD
ncbi:hypothetical protein G3M48_000148 [Beauveria asiatica]|uniref:Uncharacterized protein n=1 Tax=Beauveria asiatica TaxID=1069075 RepID=A0AAW0S1S7_9HYPO